MQKIVKIDGINVGNLNYVPIIAEIGVNHLGSLERAKNMCKLAIEGGADFLKFQTYVAEKRYDQINNPKGKEFTKNLKEWQLSKDDERELWKYAKDLGGKVFTSVYEAESIEFAMELETCAFKIAAFEMNNLKLLKEVINTKKPLIISCGMTNIDEIKNLAKFLDENNSEYVLLHTVSSYPLEKKHSNLKMIHILRENFKCPVGHSDHTHGTDIPPLAVAAGAAIIEKHFTDNIKFRLSDNFFSITKECLKIMRFNMDLVSSYLNSNDLIADDPEKFMRNFKKFSK